MAKENLRSRAASYSASGRGKFRPRVGLQPLGVNPNDVYYRQDPAQFLTEGDKNLMSLAKTFASISPTLEKFIMTRHGEKVQEEETKAAADVAGMTREQQEAVAGKTSPEAWALLEKQLGLRGINPHRKKFIRQKAGEALGMEYARTLQSELPNIVAQPQEERDQQQRDIREKASADLDQVSLDTFTNVADEIDAKFMFKVDDASRKRTVDEGFDALADRANEFAKHPTAIWEATKQSFRDDINELSKIENPTAVREAGLKGFSVSLLNGMSLSGDPVEELQRSLDKVTNLRNFDDGGQVWGDIFDPELDALSSDLNKAAGIRLTQIGGTKTSLSKEKDELIEDIVGSLVRDGKVVMSKGQNSDESAAIESLRELYGMPDLNLRYLQGELNEINENLRKVTPMSHGETKAVRDLISQGLYTPEMWKNAYVFLQNRTDFTEIQALYYKNYPSQVVAALEPNFDDVISGHVSPWFDKTIITGDPGANAEYNNWISSFSEHAELQLRDYLDNNYAELPKAGQEVEADKWVRKTLPGIAKEWADKNQFKGEAVELYPSVAREKIFERHTAVLRMARGRMIEYLHGPGVKKEEVIGRPEELFGAKYGQYSEKQKSEVVDALNKYADKVIKKHYDNPTSSPAQARKEILGALSYTNDWDKFSEILGITDWEKFVEKKEE